MPSKKCDLGQVCQMDKGATAVGMDPLEYRILNAYRDGDMKAHRREAKNCALIECAQVAAEKANWPLRDEFRKMSSRKGGGATRPERAATSTAQHLSHERPAAAAPVPAPPTQSAAPPPGTSPARSSHGAQRFSSVFGTRRRS
jgi:hypothetical protein